MRTEINAVAYGARRALEVIAAEIKITRRRVVIAMLWPAIAVIVLLATAVALTISWPFIFYRGTKVDVSGEES